MYNAVQFLTANVAAGGQIGLRPGDPVSIPVRPRVRALSIARPDGGIDAVATAGADTAHYARTRLAGVYRCEGTPPGDDKFAVNLFNATESDVRPSDAVHIGANQVATSGQLQSVNRPFWPWLLGGILFVLLLEWVVYNKRVFV
jgi:hypothetical protein